MQWRPMLTNPIWLSILVLSIAVFWGLVWSGKAGRTRRSIRKREPIPVERQILESERLGDSSADQLAGAWRFVARCYRLNPDRLRASDTVAYLNDTDYLRGDLALRIEAELQGGAAIPEDTPLIELARIVAQRRTTSGENSAQRK